MEYIYSAMLLHSAGKEVSEDAVKKIIQAAGVTAEDAKVKALVAALKDVNIDEAVAKASVMQVASAAPAASAPAGKAEAKKEEVEEKKTEEEAASGLSALFG